MKDDEKSKSDTGSTSRKVKNLQKQYNKILVDLFTKYAPECIEEALEEVEGSFGQNIHDVIQKASDYLKTKVFEELGVEAEASGVAVVTAGPMGGVGGISFGGEELEDLGDEEHMEHEAEETPEEEKEERETGIEDEEEEDEEEE
jgi:hypothetical protein